MNPNPNQQPNRTHTHKQTGVMTTLFPVENHAHHDAAGLDLSLATLQCLPATSWRSVCKIFVPTRVLPTKTCRRDKIWTGTLLRKKTVKFSIPAIWQHSPWQIHGAGIYANMTGVKNVGIHEAPYIAAPLGSYRCAASPMAPWPAGEKCRPSDRSSGQLLSSSLIRAGCHWLISIGRNPLKAMENCKKNIQSSPT